MGHLNPLFYQQAAVHISAGSFEYMNHGYSPVPTDIAGPQRHCKSLVRHLISRTSESPKTVLDVGCGRGGPARQVLESFEHSTVFAFDFVKENLPQGSEEKGIFFFQADAERIPLASVSIELAYSIESLHLHGDPINTLIEIFRILKPDGVFLLADGGEPERLMLVQNALQRLFGLVEPSDITPNIVEALQLYANEEADYHQRLSKRSLADNFFLKNIHHFLHTEMLARYLAGEFIYKTFFCRKSMANNASTCRLKSGGTS